MVTNKHLNEFRGFDFTIDFNVKNPKGTYLLSEDDMNFEQETGMFTNKYAKGCFEAICKLKYSWIEDWNFAGRSNGWFILLCNNVMRVWEVAESLPNTYKYILIIKLITKTQKHKTNPPFLIHVVSSCLRFILHLF